jgi:hypothetical protein
MPKGSLTKHASIRGREAYLGVPHLPKILVVGPIKMDLPKKRKEKKCGCNRSLINRV